MGCRVMHTLFSGFLACMFGNVVNQNHPVSNKDSAGKNNVMIMLTKAGAAGMVDWANSRDPILQRYGVGGVARAAVSGGPGLAAVIDAGGLKALVSALAEDDPQAQCFAAAAIGQYSLWLGFRA